MADKSKQSTDEQLIEKLKLYLIRKEQASEYERLKKELKPVFEGQANQVFGDFEVTGKWVSQPEKRIPACKYWDMRVKPIIK